MRAMFCLGALWGRPCRLTSLYDPPSIERHRLLLKELEKRVNDVDESLSMEDEYADRYLVSARRFTEKGYEVGISHWHKGSPRPEDPYEWRIVMSRAEIGKMLSGEQHGQAG